MSGNTDWLEWLAEIMTHRPKNNAFLESPRGIEVGRLCIAFERDNFSWRRSDTDTFWIDVQLFVKYKLSDEDILFALRMQGGTENYRKHAEERNAYAEFMRGLMRLRQFITD